MTVRIRQLLRTATTPPPPPPPVATMKFVQQPTDIEFGEAFDPVVTVQISDNANDILIATSDTCGSFIAPVTVVAVNGLATFTGLGASFYTGDEGFVCTIRVANISRPQVVEIVSDTFNLVPVPLPPGWQLLATFGSNSPDGSSVLTTVPPEAETANLLVVVIGQVGNGAFNFADSVGNGYQSTGTFGGAAVWSTTVRFMINPVITPGMTIFAWATVWPRLQVFAFSTPLTPFFFFNGGRQVVTNNAIGLSVPAVGAVTPPDIPFTDSVSITVAVRDEAVGGTVTTPANYLLAPPGASFISCAHRIRPDAGIEDPIWTFSVVQTLAFSLVIFGAA
jgi:hypothetical protein